MQTLYKAFKQAVQVVFHSSQCENKYDFYKDKSQII